MRKIKSVGGVELYCSEGAKTLREAVIEAVGRKTNLRYADLQYANLYDADLQYADLQYADLYYADLRYTNLQHTNLQHTNLQHTNLSYANLRYANLRYANFLYTDLQHTNLLYTELPDCVPFISNLDAAILAAIEAGGKLDMSAWHTCETAHCRAGWAVHLAGDEGAKLQKELGVSVAGALIYAKSYPDMPIPDFFATNEAALQDMIDRARKGE